MFAKVAYLTGAAFLIAGVDAGVAAPSQLYGRSVLVSWNENRVQSAAGSSTMQHRTVNQSLSVYISNAGRLFSRREATGYGARGARHGTSDQIGTEGRTVGGLTRRVSFEGRSLVFDFAFQSGARRIVITFDETYGSCVARVIHGKESGRATTAYRTLTGFDIVVHSMEITGMSCRILNGNVFAVE